MHKVYISKAYLSPDYLLGEVTQPSENRLSDTTMGTPCSVRHGRHVRSDTDAMFGPTRTPCSIQHGHGDAKGTAHGQYVRLFRFPTKNHYIYPC